jgi:hypothetical protein
VRARRVVVVSLGLAAVGLAMLLVGLATDARRAWFSYLDAWLFGTSVAVGALLLEMTGHAAKASWMVVTRRLTEAVADTLTLDAALFVPLAFGLKHAYPWAAPEAAADPELREALAHKHVWLSEPFFVARSAIYLAIFCAVAGLLRRWSIANDRRPSVARVQRMRRLSGGALPLVALTLTWASFDWSMSLQPEWYSTMFGVYFFAGSFVGAIALVCVMLHFSRMRQAPAVRVTGDHAQALGRVLFAMIVFWAYVSYGQLLIYWIGDIPEEVTYFARRTAGTWSALTYFIVFGHFIVPFFVLLNRHLKRHLDVLAAVGAWMLMMHFVDVYWQVLPVHDPDGFRPHWLDLGSILFVGGLSSAWIVRRYFTAAPLPLHDPGLAEGLNYEAAV